MYCENCGRKLTGGETRCPGCGALIPSTMSLDPRMTEQNGEPMPENKEKTNPLSGGAPVPRFDEQTGRPLAPENGQEFHPQTGFCARCGQRLAPGQTTCSFCGQPVAPAERAPYPPPYGYNRPYTYDPGRPAPPVPVSPAPDKKKGLPEGIVALGLLFIAFSLLDVFPLSIFLPFVSLVLGIVATVRGAKSKNTAAVIVGVIAVIIAGIYSLIFIVVLVSMLSGTYDDYQYETYSYVLSQLAALPLLRP